MSYETLMVITLVACWIGIVMVFVLVWWVVRCSNVMKAEAMRRWNPPDYSGEKIGIKDRVLTVKSYERRQEENMRADLVVLDMMVEMFPNGLNCEPGGIMMGNPMEDVAEAWEEAFRETEGIYSGCELAAGALIYLRCAMNRRMREKTPDASAGEQLPEEGRV